MNQNDEKITSTSPVVSGNLKIGAGLVLILISFLLLNPAGSGWDNACPAVIQLVGVILLISGLFVRFRNRKGVAKSGGGTE